MYLTTADIVVVVVVLLLLLEEVVVVLFVDVVEVVAVEFLAVLFVVLSDGLSFLSDLPLPSHPVNTNAATSAKMAVMSVFFI